MNAVLNILDRALRGVLVLLMSAMVLAVTWQVVSRYLLSSPSPWTEEVARFLLIWIGTLGAAYAFRTRMHIGLDLLPRHLEGAAKRRLHRFTTSVIILFAVAVLIVGGGSLVLLTWDLGQTSAALALPIAFVYSIIPLTGLLVVIYSLAAFGEVPAADVAGEYD